MNKEELLSFVINNKSNPYLMRDIYFKTNLSNNYNEVISWNEKYFKLNSFTWRQMLYNYLYNIIEIPKCKNENCNNEVNFYNGKKIYLDYCCNKCAQTSQLIRDKKKQTTMENCGVEFPMQSKEIRDKTKLTFIKNYGVDNPSKSEDIQKKKILEIHIGLNILEHFLLS